MEEIKNAIFDINPNKTPGLDGFGAEFFFPELLGDELVHCIQDFFLHGKLLKEINHTFITLIPKSSQSYSTSHFRQISLRSTICKIIAKILVNHLQPLLAETISPFQSAFIPGRSIHDNILITHEIMHKFKITKGKLAWAAVKLDMEKAYNKLKWDFLFTCLTQVGFHHQWIRWIKECATIVLYSMLVNNSSHGLFQPSWGIRQGDPLSPYLFILCMNAFCVTLCKLASTPKSRVGGRHLS